MAPAEPVSEQERRLQGLVVWRLVVGGLLLGGTLWLNLGAGLVADGFTPVMLSALIVVTFASSVLALGGRLAGWPFTPRALVPLLADLVLATGLVYLSGGAGSAFSMTDGLLIQDVKNAAAEQGHDFISKFGILACGFNLGDFGVGCMLRRGSKPRRAAAARY